jgi:predicted patatin/cPLA2 family phospholipase
MTEVVVLPISGGGLFTQLGIMCNIVESNRDYKPDIMMGSSGGCLASYISLAANFKSDYILNIVKNLSHRDYIKSEWTPEFIRPLFQNYVYDDNRHGIINNIVVGGILNEVEIWMGAFESHESKAALFCNKRREECILRFDIEQLGTSPCVYLDENAQEIIEAMRASVNIPCLKPQVNIRGKLYSDGGGRYASPLTSLRHEVIKIPSFHLIYISSENLDKGEYREHNNIIKTGIVGVNELIRSIKIQDRQVARDLIPQAACIELDNLKQYFEIRDRYNRTVLELYPEVPNSVNILNFDSKASIQCLNYASTTMRIKLWYPVVSK